MDSFINFQNTKIHYNTAGQGNTIVLIHGFLESKEIWNKFSTEFAKEFQVIIIDLPGFGKSSCVSNIHTMDLMAESVKAVLDESKIQHCVMIGHSMGGYVTLAFAEIFPGILKGLGLFHSHASDDSEEAKINRDRTIQLIEKNRMGFIQFFIPDLFASANRKRFDASIQKLKKQAGETQKESIIAALQGMKNRPDRTLVLKTATYPVLFILGQEDTRIPVDIALKQTKGTKRCEIHLLRDVGHMGFIEDEKYTMYTIKHFAHKCFSR